jgi:iron(III) transport system ATP-binding protein
VKKRVNEILRLVQLEELAPRPSSLLSGGQQQRVAVARALVARPQLLLMDEPLSNLDAKLRIEMRHELRDLFERLRLTALYVTHDQEEALVLSHRIAVMQNGRVVQLGAPMEIYKEPANLFVAGFVGTTNLLEGRVLSTGTGGELGTVKTAAGELRCSVPEQIAQEQEVALMFRPEAVSVHTSVCEGKMNVLRGKVGGVVFTGNRVEYDIDVGEGRIRADANPYLTPSEKGQIVWIEVPVDRIRVMSA